MFLLSTFHLISNMTTSCFYTHTALSEVIALYKHWLLVQQWAQVANHHSTGHCMLLSLILKFPDIPTSPQNADSIYIYIYIYIYEPKTLGILPSQSSLQSYLQTKLYLNDTTFHNIGIFGIFVSIQVCPAVCSWTQQALTAQCPDKQNLSLLQEPNTKIQMV